MIKFKQINENTIYIFKDHFLFGIFIKVVDNWQVLITNHHEQILLQAYLKDIYDKLEELNDGRI